MRSPTLIGRYEKTVPASVRCTPATWMSRTVKGSNAKAATGSANDTEASAGASVNSARKCKVVRRAWRFAVRAHARSAGRRSEQSGKIIEECEGHQYGERRNADALADLECVVGDGTAFDDFGEIIQQMPTIQQRNRQQVEHAQADADQGQVADEDECARLRGLAREVGQRQRPADVAQRRVAGEDPAQHFQREYRNLPRPPPALHQQL